MNETCPGTRVTLRRLHIRKNILVGFGSAILDYENLNDFLVPEYTNFTMSKNTGASVFRKVNIDEFDENNFQDDVVADEQVAGPEEAEVNQLLMSKKNVDALKAVLKNPPISSKDQAVKDKAFKLVIQVLTAFKSSEVEGAVGSLDNDTLDILMKYIYRGFSEPTEGTAGVLLTWHEKVHAVGGVGSIIRVLTDRKGV